jgi:serine/threonine protein kinase
MNLLPGTILGQRYRIDALLGEGGMGAVYRATDWRGGGCALKVLRPEYLASADMQRRFDQEARIGMHFRHPNVRQIWDVGVDAYTCLPYLAMELLLGEDVAARIAWRGFLQPEEVDRLLVQLCGALAAAHAAGIVHRDLKPENLFLAASPGGNETLKVLDFGIAKVLAGHSPANSMILGTPSWMAPEQLGINAEIGPSTDVWALGLLVFFALTGRSYWPAANASSVSYGAIIAEIMDASKRVLASARASQYGCPERILPGGFDVWFAACTAIEPGDRYRDVTTCGAALRRVLGTAPTAMAAGAPFGRVSPPVLPDEDPLIAQVIGELRQRLPGALAAAAESAGAVGASTRADAPHARIPLVKGPKPTFPPVSPIQPWSPAPSALVPRPPQFPAHVQRPPSSWTVPANKDLRFAAAVIDRIAALLVGGMVGAVFGALNEGLLLIGVVIFFACCFFRDVVGGGRSLGKRIFNLEIIDTRTGASIGMDKALGRQLLSLEIVPVGGVLVDSILVLVRDDGQRTGDLLLDTQVVQRRRS